MDLSGPKIRTANIYDKNFSEKKDYVRVYVDDVILVVKTVENSRKVENYKAVVTCTISSVIDDVQIGQSILFDDGKIEGVIEERTENALQVRIVNTSPKGGKLKKEKGINLPDTHLNLPSLTKEDINYLDFICAHADIVGFSFVRNQIADALTAYSRLEILKGSTERQPEFFAGPICCSSSQVYLLRLQWV